MLEMALKQSQALHVRILLRTESMPPTYPLIFLLVFQSMQHAEENTTRRNLDLVENVNDRLMKSLEIAEHSNVAFDELREVIARQSNMGFPLWRYLELAGNCKHGFDYVAASRSNNIPSGLVLPYFSSPSFMALKSQPLMSPFALLITTLGTVCFNALAFAFYSIVSRIPQESPNPTTTNTVFRRPLSGSSSAQASGGWRDERAACCIWSTRLFDRSICEMWNARELNMTAWKS